MFYFTHQDTDSAFSKYPQPKISTPECPEPVEEIKVQDETHGLHSEVQVPERDEKPSNDVERDCRETNAPSGGDTEHEGVQRGCAAETAAQALHVSNSILQHG